MKIVFPLFGEDYLCHDDFNHFNDSQRFPPHERLRHTRFIGEKVPVDGLKNRRQEELEDRLLQAEEECQRLRQQRDQLLGSTSWKITAPLRGIKTALMRKRA